MNKDKTLLVVVVILLATSIFFIFEYSTAKNQLQAVNSLVLKQNTNKKILDFTGFFIEKVLSAKQAVSFEDRLSLENMVREINDNEIMTAWNKFVSSRTESQAQEEVKNLLGLLLRKAQGK